MGLGKLLWLGLCLSYHGIPLYSPQNQGENLLPTHSLHSFRSHSCSLLCRVSHKLTTASFLLKASFLPCMIDRARGVALALPPRALWPFFVCVGPIRPVTEGFFPLIAFARSFSCHFWGTRSRPATSALLLHPSYDL